MPDIWTIGASTGDIIAITPPRDGSGQRGSFDWLRVIRHEFVHTITLDQTSNRVPHWFTEGAAVWQEPGDRDYNTARLLAQAVAAKALFTLDQINWGFIRPKRQIDRPLAYAQACWMIQYIVQAFGQQSVVDMLILFNQGKTDRQAIAQVTHEDPDIFMTRFNEWARRQVITWGLGPTQLDKRSSMLIQNQDTIQSDVLDALLARYPGNPDLLLLRAKNAMKQETPAQAQKAVLRYAAARPVDPWSQESLIELAFKQGRPQQAIGALAHLDLQEQSSGAWALQMANIQRQAGQLDAAYDAMLRAIEREPYNATYREQAAAVALQNGDLKEALFELQTLPILESDRAIHQIRLAAIYHKLGRNEEANEAALAARKIDPAALVDAYLKTPTTQPVQ
jgi:tetratricopeptide (TPR) repeat protein